MAVSVYDDKNNDAKTLNSALSDSPMAPVVSMVVIYLLYITRRSADLLNVISIYDVHSLVFCRSHLSTEPECYRPTLSRFPLPASMYMTLSIHFGTTPR